MSKQFKSFYEAPVNEAIDITALKVVSTSPDATFDETLEWEEQVEF